MIKIIEGKRYDTDTAKFLIRLSSSEGVNEADRWSDLHMTKKGAFFIAHHKKGQEDGKRFDVCEITPLTEAEVISRLKEMVSDNNLDYEEVANLQQYFKSPIFGDIEDA